MRTLLLQSILMFLMIDFAIAQNLTIISYYQARNILEEVIYQSDDERITLYCQAQFDEDNNVILPEGFTADSYLNRFEKIEWEHVVPAENFGRTFPEWRDGHTLCVDDEGEPFNGRECAELASEEYRMMAYDLYNLYPAIGAVNASRSNYNFVMLPDAESNFGTCEMKIEDGKAEPPEHARGIIARAYLYMETTYPRYRMSDQQRQLMNAWDRMYPPTEWEIERSERVQEMQGNGNEFIKENM